MNLYTLVRCLKLVTFMSGKIKGTHSSFGQFMSGRIFLGDLSWKTYLLVIVVFISRMGGGHDIYRHRFTVLPTFWGLWMLRVLRICLYRNKSLQSNSKNFKLTSFTEAWDLFSKVLNVRLQDYKKGIHTYARQEISCE